jgi:hypothetical protein
MVLYSCLFRGRCLATGLHTTICTSYRHTNFLYDEPIILNLIFM